MADALSVVTIILAIFIVLVAVCAIRLITLRIRAAVMLKDFDGPSPHWLFGNLHKGAFQFTENGVRMYMTWHKMYGGIFTIWHSSFRECQLVITDPKYAAVVLGRRVEKDPKIFKFFVPVIGDGLVSSHGAKWQRHRLLLTPLFHSRAMSNYVETFVKSVNIMMESWRLQLQEVGSLEMYKSMSLLTLDAFHQCMFGSGNHLQPSRSRQDQFTEAIATGSPLISDHVITPLYNIDWVYRMSAARRKLLDMSHVVRKYTRDVVMEHQRRTQSATGEAPSCFLNALLEARDEDGYGLTTDEIVDEVTTFMIAGHDTTANTLSWCLYYLARHPIYQEKCREEIKNVLGDRDHATWEDFSKLQFLTQCINETMRLIPTVPLLGHVTTRTLTLADGRKIPEGTVINTSIYTIHRNPDIWIDPELFDPDRFTMENRAKRGPYDFIPFSAGPRQCIGKHFAMAEMKTLLTSLLKNFRFEVDESVKVELVHAILLRTKNGIWLKTMPL